MRMWMVHPEIMCRKHLFGEHVECHMFIGSIKKGISMTGYLNGQLLEAHMLKERHDQIAYEIENRGYTHNSPVDINFSILQNGNINSKKSLLDLINRCPNCSSRYENWERKL